MAVRTRRLIETGVFIPPSPIADSRTSAGPVCRPARPIVQILFVRYLAARPVEQIQCIAQTLRRQRCSRPVLADELPGGQWILAAVAETSGQLSLLFENMAVYSLSALSYAEQLRWRSQRCPQHAAIRTAPDLARADWELFNPLLHQKHIHTRLPTARRGRGPHRR